MERPSLSTFSISQRLSIHYSITMMNARLALIFGTCDADSTARQFENSTVPFALISPPISAIGAAILPLRQYSGSITGADDGLYPVRPLDGRIRESCYTPSHSASPLIHYTHNHPQQQALSPSPSPPRAPNGRITMSRRGRRSATAVRSIVFDLTADPFPSAHTRVTRSQPGQHVPEPD